MGSDRRLAALAKARVALAEARANGLKTGPKRGWKKAGLPAALDPVAPLVRARDHHHKLARMVAAGRSSREIAAVTGLTVSRVSHLREDATIVALVERYRGVVAAQEEELYASRRVKEELLLHNALDHLNDHYADEPDSISHAEARGDYALVTERFDSAVVKPQVIYHGNTSELPLAELVNLQRARADRMLSEMKDVTPITPEGVDPSPSPHAPDGVTEGSGGVASLSGPPGLTAGPLCAPAANENHGQDSG